MIYVRIYIYIYYYFSSTISVYLKRTRQIRGHNNFIASPFTDLDMEPATEIEQEQARARNVTIKPLPDTFNARFEQLKELTGKVNFTPFIYSSFYDKISS
jgi:hypothetical protein